MKKTLLFFTLLFLVTFYQVHAAAPGDYRSAQSGNWNEPSSWQTFNGTSWVIATQFPTNASGAISILNGHTITVNTEITADQVVVETGGTLNITTRLTVEDGTGTDLVVNGTLKLAGTLTGKGTSVVTNVLNWTSGSLGTRLTITTTGVASVQGSGLTLGGMFLDSGAVTNNGLIDMVAVGITFYGAAIINNGNLNVSGNSSLSQFLAINGQYYSGPPELTNNGILMKTGEGSTRLGIRVENSGLVNVSSGRLLTSGTFSVQPGSSITGNGIWELMGGLSINSPVTLPSTLTFTLSGGAIQCWYPLTLQGQMNWSRSRELTPGAIHGTLIISPTGMLNILSGPLSVMYTGILTNNGIINLNERQLVLSATLNNSGTINAIGNDSITMVNSYPEYPPQVNNSGTFVKSGAGSTTLIAAPFINTGAIKGTDRINFMGTLTNTGTVGPGLSPGTIIVNSTEPLLSPSSTLDIEISGSGGAGEPGGHDQLLREGNLALNGALTVRETGTVPQGSYEIIRLTSGILSGDFTTLNLPANYTISRNSTSLIVTKGVPSVSLLCPGDKTVPNDAGLCAAVVTGIDPLITPVGSSATYTYTLTGATSGSGTGTTSGRPLTGGSLQLLIPCPPIRPGSAASLLLCWIRSRLLPGAKE